MPRLTLLPARFSLAALLTLSTAGTLLSAFPASVLAQAGAQRYEIAAGPLGTVLGRFAATAGVLLSFDPALTQGKTSPGLSGTYTVREGLTRLLGGTQLDWAPQGDGYTVRPLPIGAATTLPTVTVTGINTQGVRGDYDTFAPRYSSTGSKTDTPLIEIPQSISIVTRQQIEETDSKSIGEALRYTAGVVTTDGGGRTNDSFLIRGFQLSGYGTTYRDGMKYAGNVYDGSQEPYGMERVEVLRGASSVLFGQTSPGGIVNVTSKLPQFEDFHEIRTQYGSFNRRELATDHTGQFTADGKWAYRVTALARESDTSIDHIPDDRIYIAPSLLFRPNASTSLTLLGTYQKTRTAYQYGLPAIGTVEYNPNGRIPARRFTGEPDYDRSSIRAYDLGYRFEHTFNDNLRVRQNLRYFDAENDFPSSSLGTYLAGTNQRVMTRSAQDRVDTSTNLVVDTQLEGKFTTGAVAHTLLGGFDFGKRSLETERYNRTLAPIDVYNPVYGAVPGPRVAALNSSRTDTYRVGTYLQDQLKIADKWVLLAGGRYDWARDDVRALFVNNSSRTRNEAFTGRAGLVYLADNGLAPYLSFSQSFEPTSGTDRSGAGFDPVEGEQYEVGVRYQPNNSDMMLSAALYQLTQKNVLTPDPVAPTQFSVQTGEIRSRGVDLEARMPITRNARITASYAYTDAEITKSNRPAEVGQQRGGTPRNMVGLWGDYRFGDFGLEGLRAGVGARFFGSALGFFNTNVSVPSYTLFDAMIGYDTGPWQFRLNGNNLADRQYISTYSYGAFYGPRRSVVASVGYRW
ncbi:TonB-dependent siderophore receptor [Alcaligenaceae bacterium B3P038]|nr:TonB-dependent siderophore receptor [Alcaligenaceae bacterium B3P038]